MQVTRLSAVLKSTLGRVEHHLEPHILVSRLREGARAVAIFLILARARNVELQRLPVVGLVEVEPRRGAIEAHLFANLLLEIAGSCLL